MSKMAKIDTLFMTKTAEKPYLWGRTYLYSPYERVLPQTVTVFELWASLETNFIRRTCTLKAETSVSG